MIIRNPREQEFPGLQSSITSDFVEPAQPKMTQTHSTRVVVVTERTQDIGEADGMVTSLKNLELHVRVADCGNIYAYDPVAAVIGLCHSGWKGAQGNILTHMITAMTSLGSQPEHIRIRMGPCISAQNYEFGPEVRDLFVGHYYELRGDKYYLDLPKLHRYQLIATGIQAEHILQSDQCTFDTLELHSYRRNGPNAGRITGSICQTV